MAEDVFWIGEIGPKDDFGVEITDTFVDGKTSLGPWGIMAPESYAQYGYSQLGPGRGQRYKKQSDGRWKKVEG